jgi:hypothetical protein
MPRIFLGNFDFEHELASVGGALLRPAAPRERQHADDKRADARSWVWMAIAEADDIVLTASKIEAADFDPLVELGLPVPRFCHSLDQLPKGEEWQLVPWGSTESLEQLGSAHRWTCHAPPAAVVRQVNSREFRFGLERDWNIGIPGAAIARSLADLEAAIAAAGDSPRGWLLKANYGMAGREAMRGRGAMLEENLRNWAARRFATNGPIVFEPIVERIAEAGIQIEIPRAGMPELMGVTPLLVDASGVYRGSRFGCREGETAGWQPAVEIGLRTACKLQQLGYFGPLGIDAMLHWDDTGATRLRALQDLNARYTMGRLALGFERVLHGRLPAANDDAWCGSWLHFSGRHLGDRGFSPWLETVQSELPAGATAVPASHRSSEATSSHAVLVVAPSPAIRNAAEAIVFDSLGISAVS